MLPKAAPSPPHLAFAAAKDRRLIEVQRNNVREGQLGSCIGYNSHNTACPAPIVFSRFYFNRESRSFLTSINIGIRFLHLVCSRILRFVSRPLLALVELQSLPQAQQYRLAESILNTLRHEQATKPSLLHDRQLLQRSKDRPTAAGSRKRAALVTTAENS